MATSQDLFSNSKTVMRHFLKEAASLIDEQFGQNYAIKNPSLVAEMARIGAEDYFETTRALRHSSFAADFCEALQGFKHEVRG